MIQYSSPQRFRAVSLDEATDTLGDQYENRFERFHNALATVEFVGEDAESSAQEV